MKNLFIGCRVRIVGSWCGIGPSPAGQEGRIRDRGAYGLYSLREYEWSVEVGGGRCIAADSEDLEPIEPPHEASDYAFRELMDRLKAGEVECV
jgi:hypothetical protein